MIPSRQQAIRSPEKLPAAPEARSIGPAFQAVITDEEAL